MYKANGFVFLFRKYNEPGENNISSGKSEMICICIIPPLKMLENGTIQIYQ